MKSLKILFVVMLIPAIVWAAKTVPYGGRAADAANRARVCIMDPAAAIQLSFTAVADADSGALTPELVHLIECDQDVWMRTGTAAVTAVADTNRKLQASRDYFFGTSDLILHVSVLGVTAAGDCRISLCN